jgi:Fur family transcriptional regulator, ferric uptake regulator
MQEAIYNFKQHLKEQDCFATKPRLQLFKAFFRNKSMSIAELIEALPNQDKSSVYRNVDLLEKLRVIKKVQLGWRFKYELTELFHDHHHHLTCLSCEKVIVLDEDLVIEQEIFRQSYRHKFKALEHTLEIRGLCSDCT